MRTAIITVLFITMLHCAFVNAAPPAVGEAKLNAALKEIYESDQRYRRELDSLIRNNSDDYEAIVNLSLLMSGQDEKNRAAALPLIDSIIKYDIRGLDSVAYSACYLVIQHAPVEIQNKYPEFIAALFRDGHISSTEYMWFTDRLNVGNYRSQKYGLQTISRMGLILLYPLNDRYNESWQELGLEFSEDVWKDIDIPPVLVPDGKFAILGFVFDRSGVSGKGKGVEGVEITVDDSVYAVTDASGYFYFLIDKGAIPDSVEISVGDVKLKRKIEYVYDSDFTIVEYGL